MSSRQDILVEYVRETVCAALSEAGRLGKLAERDRATGQPKLKVGEGEMAGEGNGSGMCAL